MALNTNSPGSISQLLRLHRPPHHTPSLSNASTLGTLPPTHRSLEINHMQATTGGLSSNFSVPQRSFFIHKDKTSCPGLFSVSVRNTTTKRYLSRKGLVWLTLPGNKPEESQGKQLETGTRSRGCGRTRPTGFLSGSCSPRCLNGPGRSYLAQILPQDGVLVSLTSIISSDNLSQMWPQANLICAVPQLRFLLPR